MKRVSDYQKVRRLVGRCLRNRRFQARRANLQARAYLNVGCGPFPTPGYVNLDYRWVPGVDVVWDLRQPLPFPAGRFRGVYSEHCLEHLDAVALDRVLRELYRILAPGGRVRLSVPSLEIHARAYVAALNQAVAAGTDGRDDEPAQVINRVFYAGHCDMRTSRWSGDVHHFIHDLASLGRGLRACGFATVTRTAWNEGADPRLLIDQAARRDESLYVEAVKPAGPADAQPP